MRAEHRENVIAIKDDDNNVIVMIELDEAVEFAEQILNECGKVTTDG